MSILLHARSLTQAVLTSARSVRPTRLLAVGVLLVALALTTLGGPAPAAASFAAAAHQTMTSAAHILPDDPCGGVYAGC